ncbi:ATP-binding protein [Rhodoferax sp.]|uniref:sensor histidine kinase n=1 Tax=Rhodoferax sp. TaxID=50421 RepID=UPI002846422F|nr:ATP-binding protein [Rhodoferax sp.]MDR3370329.1 ATP-binding protein [Rhodoferax sp.]
MPASPHSRFNTLFVRLLLMQLALVVSLGLLSVGVFYVERNMTIAELYAELWSVQITKALGTGINPSRDTSVLMQSTQPPSDARHPLILAPRFRVIRRTLKTSNIVVDDVMIGHVGDEQVVWLHVLAPAKSPVWLALPGHILTPEWPGRLLLALLVVSVLLIGASWAFTRRLTRPLEQLRLRMQTHAPGQRASTTSTDHPALLGATPEIVSIDHAYSDLLLRFDTHERERAILLAGVSHDLRSPLGRIRMAAELLPDRDGENTRQESIIRNVQVADRLIESFMDFVRSEELALNETVDVVALVRSTVARFEKPEQEVTIVVPESLRVPNSNELLLDRLVSNLVDNALKHGRCPVCVSVSSLQGNAVIDVADAGQGPQPEALKRLQAAFARGTQSRSTPGVGLGLTVVRQIVGRMGGQLDFLRQANTNVVRVTLPISSNL